MIETTPDFIPLLILSGPIGVGKSTVGDEISVQLTSKGIPHTFVDLDALAQTFPRPADDRYGSRLALKNLASLWQNCRDAGARNAVVARVVETREERDAISVAIPGCVATVCHLRAGPQTLAERVKRREIGSLQDWHLERSQELARSLEATSPYDFAVTTDGLSPQHIAEKVLKKYAGFSSFV